MRIIFGAYCRGMVASTYGMGWGCGSGRGEITLNVYWMAIGIFGLDYFGHSLGLSYEDLYIIYQRFDFTM